MRRTGGAEFLFGFRQGNQKPALVARAASEQKLQCQRGLASAWSALDKMQSTAGEPASENVIQSFSAGRGTIARSAGGSGGGRGPCPAWNALLSHSRLPSHRADRLIRANRSDAETLDDSISLRSAALSKV
jgi:hypothetical protein